MQVGGRLSYMITPKLSPIGFNPNNPHTPRSASTQSLRPPASSREQQAPTMKLAEKPIFVRLTMPPDLSKDFNLSTLSMPQDSKHAVGWVANESWSPPSFRRPTGGASSGSARALTRGAVL